jgi:hypothetical protein
MHIAALLTVDKASASEWRKKMVVYIHGEYYW